MRRRRVVAVEVAPAGQAPVGWRRPPRRSAVRRPASRGRRPTGEPPGRGDPARAHPRRPGRDGPARSRPRLGHAVAGGHGRPERAATAGRCSTCRATSWSRPPSRRRSRPAARAVDGSAQRRRGFARVRVRDELLPVLEAALGPGIVEALARTATLAREDADALDAWADRVWARAFGDPFGLRTLDEQQPGTDHGSAAGRGRAGAGDALGRCALPIAGPAPRWCGPPPAAIVHRVVRRFLIGRRLPCRVADRRAHPRGGRAARTRQLPAGRGGPARWPTCPPGGRARWL